MNNEEAAAAIARLTARLDELEARRDRPAAGEPAPAVKFGPAKPEEPVFRTVNEWVHTWFAPAFARHIGGPVRWCEQWAEHPEAFFLLEALWLSWEVHRPDYWLGPVTWAREDLIPVWTFLTSEAGTFAACEGGKHYPAPPLPTPAAPAEAAPQTEEALT